MNDLSELFLMAGETRAAVQRIEEQLKPLSALPERVTALESWRKRVFAGATAVCAIIGFAVKLLASKIGQ